MNAYKKLRVTQVVMGVLLAVFMMPGAAWGQKRGGDFVYWNSGTSFQDLLETIDNSSETVLGVYINGPISLEESANLFISPEISYYQNHDNQEAFTSPVFTIKARAEIGIPSLEGFMTYNVPLICVESGSSCYLQGGFNDCIIDANFGNHYLIELEPGANMDIHGSYISPLIFNHSSSDFIHVSQNANLSVADCIIRDNTRNSILAEEEANITIGSNVSISSILGGNTKMQGLNINIDILNGHDKPAIITGSIHSSSIGAASVLNWEPKPSELNGYIPFAIGGEEYKLTQSDMECFHLKAINTDLPLESDIVIHNNKAYFCNQNNVYVEFNLENIVASGGKVAGQIVTSPLPDHPERPVPLYFIQKGSSLSLKLSTSSYNYFLPKDITIKTSSNYELKVGDDYTYNFETGELLIKNITEPITISAQAIGKIASNFDFIMYYFGPIGNIVNGYLFNKYEYEVMLPNMMSYNTPDIEDRPVKVGDKVELRGHYDNAWADPISSTLDENFKTTISIKDKADNAYTVHFYVKDPITTNQISKLTDLPDSEYTLQEKYDDATAVCQHLKEWKTTVNYTTTSNNTGTLDVTWSYDKTLNEGKEYDPSSKTVYHYFTWAVNTSGFTLAEGVVTSGKLKLINYKQPLPPIANNTPEFIITEDGCSNGSDNDYYVVPETIGDEEIKNIEQFDIKADIGLVIKNITIEELEIDANKTVEISLIGINKWGQVVNNGNLTLMQAEDGTFTYQTITNNGIFVDNTATVSEVLGISALKIEASSTIPSNQTIDSGETITLFANIYYDRSNQNNITFKWQKYNETTHKWEDYQVQIKALTKTNDAADAGTINVAEKGIYRCQITNTASSGCSTTLYTAPTTLSVKNDPNPPYIPTYYTVTLPEIEGATLSRKSGDHTVEELYNFTFSLTLDEDYNLSVPVVKANGEVIEPRLSDGEYVIRNIQEDINVTISGIQKNLATDNPDVFALETRIYSLKDVVIIETPIATDARIVTIGGVTVRQLHLLPGTSRIQGLAPGMYLIGLSNGTKGKVLIR